MIYCIYLFLSTKLRDYGGWLCGACWQVEVNALACAICDKNKKKIPGFNADK